jgi:hypothetical protein
LVPLKLTRALTDYIGIGKRFVSFQIGYLLKKGTPLLFNNRVELVEQLLPQINVTVSVGPGELQFHHRCQGLQKNTTCEHKNAGVPEPHHFNEVLLRIQAWRTYDIAREIFNLFFMINLSL